MQTMAGTLDYCGMCFRMLCVCLHDLACDGVCACVVVVHLCQGAGVGWRRVCVAFALLVQVMVSEVRFCICKGREMCL